MPLRGPRNYDRDAASAACALDLSGEKSLTVQSARKECDINEIVRRFGVTGELPVSRRVPLDVGFYDLVDFRSCLDAVRRAEQSFESMPANVRSRFDNDPGKLVDFVMDDKNRAEAEKLGLVRPAPAPAPSPDPSGSS